MKVSDFIKCCADPYALPMVVYNDSEAWDGYSGYLPQQYRDAEVQQYWLEDGKLMMRIGKVFL